MVRSQALMRDPVRPGSGEVMEERGSSLWSVETAEVVAAVEVAAAQEVAEVPAQEAVVVKKAWRAGKE